MFRRSKGKGGAAVKKSPTSGTNNLDLFLTPEIPDDDPALMEEMRALGFVDPGEHKAKSAPSSQQPQAVLSFPMQNDGGGMDVDLSFMGDDHDHEMELTEDDFNDPDLLGELDNFSDDGHDHTQNTHTSQENDPPSQEGHTREAEHPLVSKSMSIGDEDFEDCEDVDDDNSSLPAPVLAATKSVSNTSSKNLTPVVHPPNNSEFVSMEQQIMEKKKQALALSKTGDKAGALELLRQAKEREQSLSIDRVLQSASQLAEGKVVTGVIPGPAPKAQSQTSSQENMAGASPAPPPPPPIPERKTSPDVTSLTAQARTLKSSAIAASREGRTADALALLKRAKSMEEQVDRLTGRAGSTRIIGAGGEESSRSAAARRRGSNENGSSNNIVRQTSSQSAMDTTGSPATVPSSPMPSRASPEVEEAFRLFEEALRAAMKTTVAKAKELLPAARADAAVETTRAKELQKHLARLKEFRNIPGASPPPFHWQMSRRNRIRQLTDIRLDEMKLTIGELHAGLLLGKKGTSDIQITYDLSVSKENVDKGQTGWVKAAAGGGAPPAMIGHTASIPIARTRSVQMAFQNRKATFEIVRGLGFLRGTEVIARAVVPLAPLLRECSLQAAAPLLNEGRREVGGHIDITLQLRRPISAEEIQVVEEAELVVGEWPPVGALNTPNSVASYSIFESNSSVNSHNTAEPMLSVPALPPRGSLQPSSASKESAPSTHTPTKQANVSAQDVRTPSDPVTPSTNTPGEIELSTDEISDPMSYLHIDSNNVLEAEIAAYETNGVSDAAGAQRRAQLQLKLKCLESAVNSGELTLPDYCKMLEARIARDKALAVRLKAEGRVQEALKVFKRVRVMDEELKECSQMDEG